MASRTIDAARTTSGHRRGRAVRPTPTSSGAVTGMIAVSDSLESGEGRSSSRSSALRYREEGFFERAFSTIASSVLGTGEMLEIFFGSSFRMEKVMTVKFSPLYVGWYVSI